MPPDQVGEDPLARTSRQLLQVAARRSGPNRVETALAARPLPGERLRYVLEERIAELELRLRERNAKDDLHELEVRAFQQELQLRAEYVGHLEAAQAGLHRRLADEQTHNAALWNELERVRREVADMGSELVAIKSRRLYRLMNEMLRVLRVVLWPALALRRVLRRLRSRG